MEALRRGLAQPGLPFASVLSAERIERAFVRHGNLFGSSAVYSTAVMVWSFLGQVLRDGKEASCQAAVARLAVHQQQCGEAIPTSDTGDYCRARAKLSEAALAELTRDVAGELDAHADPAWLWKGRHAKLVDGFTFTMPDTPANQAAYPQHTAQKPGVGFPIARACAILSLATACVRNLAIGPYAGKETGETALLRELFDSLDVGDVLVRAIGPDRPMRGRSSPRSHRASRTQTTTPRLQAYAGTTRHAPHATRARQLDVSKSVTTTTVPFVTGSIDGVVRIYGS